MVNCDHPENCGRLTSDSDTRLMNPETSGMRFTRAYQKPVRPLNFNLFAHQRNIFLNPFIHGVIMNRIIATTLIAATAAFAGQVLADDITPSQPFVSTEDRAQVKAEIAQAHAANNPSSMTYNPLAIFQSSRTRADVRAEYIADRDEVAALTGEDSGAFALAQEQESEAQVAGAAGDAVAQ
jgi:hypothetical protein